MKVEIEEIEHIHCGCSAISIECECGGNYEIILHGQRLSLWFCPHCGESLEFTQ